MVRISRAVFLFFCISTVTRQNILLRVTRYIRAMLRLCLGSAFGLDMDKPLRLVHGVLAVPALGPIPAPHTSRSSFGRPAESRVWPIRHSILIPSTYASGTPLINFYQTN